jgi:hypothetical protein
MGEVGEGALAGFVVLAPAFAEEDGGGELRLGMVSMYMGS